MLFPEKILFLRDGRAAVIRPPEITDAAELLAFIQTCQGETDFLAGYPEEKSLTIQQEEEWIARMRQSPCALSLVCTVGGEIAGSGQLVWSPRIKLRHRGTVGITVLKRFWGLGIGSALMEQMLSLAPQCGLTQLELEYIQGNERARRLYDKMGFLPYGRRPQGIRLKDGTLLDEILMCKQF